MRVALKLVAFVLIGVFIAVGVDGYVTYRRETEFFDRDMQHDEVLLGRTLKQLVRDAWHAEGEARAQALLADANRLGDLDVHIVWLDGSRPDASPDLPTDQLLQRLRGGHVVSVVKREKHKYGSRLTYIPIKLEGTGPTALELSESLQITDEYTNTTIHNVFWLALATAISSACVSIVLGVRLVGRPLHRVAEKARRVGAGDLTEPLSLRGHDELEEVALALNAMCDQLAASREQLRRETAERIATLEQLRHADRLRTVGRLASGVAHELGTPMMVISARANMIAAENLSDTEVVENALIIKAESVRMTKIVRQLLDFARRRSPRIESTNLDAIMHRATELYSSVAIKEKKSLTVIPGEKELHARVDAAQIQQVVTNLISNALQAVSSGGNVQIGAVRARVKPPPDHGGPEDNFLCLYVRDNGSGMAEDTLAHIFEPFFTTKDVGEGTGLGLSISYGIVQEHGGWIEVSSEVGVGSKFSVYLPENRPCADAS